jgi:ribose 5-phosphate isomerase A
MLHIERVARGLGHVGPLTMREAEAWRFITDGAITSSIARSAPSTMRLTPRCAAFGDSQVVDHGLFIGLATAIFIAGAGACAIWENIRATPYDFRL